ncbi:MAG: haloacid dehalogenase-like hydrolase [Pedosphaera sp.]|nr:haloacid dehalogenase-like hydrolase [Pedosphaera sp.]
MASAKRKPAKSRRCKLESPGWNEKTRRALERLIDRGAGKNLPVVFDFDNTLVCGDVQEATLAVLARSGRLTAARLPETLSPSFRLPGKGLVTLQSGADLTEYYEAFLAPTAHGDRDPTPLANGYAWAVEVLEHLRVSEVVAATREACEFARAPHDGFIEVTPGKTRFPAPRFYPEMVELVAELIRHRFDVWIISASNVWSVRWMVQHELNPRLRQHGLKQGLRADHVIGISTLLTDRSGRLYKDALLVRNDPGYAALDEKTLRSFRLTSRLQFPVPTYSGKIACIFDAIGDRPYLCAGDSPGDHPMLVYSRHRLWIARLEKPGYQKKLAQLIRKTGSAGWMIQAARTRGEIGFVSAPAPVA